MEDMSVGIVRSKQAWVKYNINIIEISSRNIKGNQEIEIEITCMILILLPSMWNNKSPVCVWSNLRK